MPSDDVLGVHLAFVVFATNKKCIPLRGRFHNSQILLCTYFSLNKYKSACPPGRAYTTVGTRLR